MLMRVRICIGCSFPESVVLLSCPEVGADHTVLDMGTSDIVAHAQVATRLWTQPDELAGCSRTPVRPRRPRGGSRGAGWLVGIGTSWHAAHHGAWMLRDAGVEADRCTPPTSRPTAPHHAGTRVIVLSHTGTPATSMQMLERAREAGAAVVHISGVGNGGEVETVAAETSYAYTASHTGALLRLAQMAERAGRARSATSRRCPTRWRAVLDAPGRVDPPARLLELIGAGPERVDRAGGRAEDPRGVLRRHRGPVRPSSSCTARASRSMGRTRSSCSTAAAPPQRARRRSPARWRSSARSVVRIAERDLGEPLSVFPLTVGVQRIALELARDPRGQSRPLPLRGGPPPRAGDRVARLLS